MPRRSYDYKLDPPADPQWCDIHHCVLVETADEDGAYHYCPECDADINTPPFINPCAHEGCDREIGNWGIRKDGKLVNRPGPHYCFDHERRSKPRD